MSDGKDQQHICMKASYRHPTQFCIYRPHNPNKDAITPRLVVLIGVVAQVANCLRVV